MVLRQHSSCPSGLSFNHPRLQDLLNVTTSWAGNENSRSEIACHIKVSRMSKINRSTFGCDWPFQWTPLVWRDGASTVTWGPSVSRLKLLWKQDERYSISDKLHATVLMTMFFGTLYKIRAVESSWEVVKCYRTLGNASWILQRKAAILCVAYVLWYSIKSQRRENWWCT